MATIQAVLRRKPNKQMHFPIAIRITRNRKSTFIFTGQYIEEKYWDKIKNKVKPSHPNSAILNQLILTKMSNANRNLIDAELSPDLKSLIGIKRKITGTGKGTFRFVADLYLENILSRKKSNQHITEKNRINQFLLFAKNSSLQFNEIDTALLKKFDSYLFFEKEKSRRTVANYMICIRTIYNLAISEGHAERNYYPFGKGRYQIRIPESIKIGLTVEEVKKLEGTEGLTESQQHALHVWLLSFYFAGIRITDVIQLKWTDLIGDRLYYSMSKNGKLVSMKIPEKAQKILDGYKIFKDPESPLIFLELRSAEETDEIRKRTRIKTVTRNFNRHLKNIASILGISKNLSMHMSRHSFGHISGDKIPVQMLQKLYRHSSITTTMQYQANFISKDADDALDKVINF